MPKKSKTPKKPNAVAKAKTEAIRALKSSPTGIDWNTLHKTAAYLEKAKLADYVEMMNHPWRSIFPNLLAGIARGAGIVIGGSVVGVLFVVLLVSGLKAAFQHAGGVPWIGEEVKEGIGWILEVIRQHGGGE
jgi:hypothetical protein